MRDPSERDSAFEALFRARGIGAAFLDTAGRLLRVNPFLCDLLGYREDELVGRRIQEFALADADEDWAFLSKLARGQASSIEAERYLADRHGRVIAAWMHLEVERDLPREARGIALQVQDVSLHRRVEERFRAVFESASLGIAILDLEGRTVAANPALRRILGYRADELTELTHGQLLHPDDAADGERELARLLAGEQDRLEAERRFWTRDGRFVWLRLNLSLVRGASGAPDFAVMVCEDVTERRLAEETLRTRTLQLLRLVPATANEAATVEEALQVCVTQVCQEMGWPVGHGLLVDDSGALAATAAWHLDEPERYEAFREASMAMRIAASEGLLGQMLARGTPAWLPEGAAERMPARGEVAQRVGVRAAMMFPILIGAEVAGALEFFSDRPVPPDPMIAEVIAQIGVELGHVIQRKRMEAYIAFHALHDSLTKLPNRALFMDRLKHALARMERSGHPVALLFLDVDGFKEVNDALGHGAGDQLLTSLAARLGSVLRPEDTVARLGGDEFTVLCEGVVDAAEARSIASRVARAMKARFGLKGGERTVTLSIGIALAERADVNPEELIRNADAAMYQAKKRGGGRYVMFDAALRAQVLGRPGRVRALRRAVEQDQLRLVYQPGIALRDDTICGIEALVRWQHPERGMLEPDDIIPLAEGSGLILPLGEWVLEQACRQAAGWAALAGRRVGLWVNFSSRQLHTGQPAATIAAALESTGLAPGDLTLEITESVLLGDTASVVAELEAIRSLGVNLSIDDFGTGYSSLSYLRRIPIDNVKLDRSFVKDLAKDSQAKAITSAIIHLAHALDLTVVAEGVETREQLESLRALGCDCAQGFYFARPQPASEIERLLSGAPRARPTKKNGQSGGRGESSA